MILTLPVLTAEEVQQLRALLAQGPWQDGRASAGLQAALVKNNAQLATGSEAANQARALVLQALERSPQFLSAALPRRLFPPAFNRYGGDQNHYGRHVDNAVRFTDAGLAVRTDLSCTLFLSEPADYEGGELVLHEAGTERPIKLPAGHAVLYPGTCVHEVRPVTRGQRIASFFWIESMVRDPGQRALLLDFDRALMALRQQGETDTTVALTGTYHNLLRLWAAT